MRQLFLPGMPAGQGWGARYAARLAASDWKFEIRPRILERAGCRCERCGAAGPLEVHHETYARFWRELDSDLLALCPACHKLADAEREAEAARIGWHNAQEAGERARFDRFCDRHFSDDDFCPADAWEMFSEKEDRE